VTFVINVAISALAIAFCAWLAGRAPALAGFLIALPLASMVAVPMSYVQHGDAAASATFARSIFAAIPVSLCFFAPFIAGERLGLGFWTTYALGVAALVAGYFAHRAIAQSWLGS